MRRILIAMILALGLLLILPSVASAALGVTVVDKTGDGAWDDNTWKVKMFPGETKSTTITLYNSSSSALNIETSVSPDSLDEGNLTFELDKTNFTMLGGSDEDVTLTVKASGSATPGIYSTELTIKSEVPTPAADDGDRTSPRIYNIRLCDITETTADICWRTNERSTSQVRYWISPSKLSSLDKTYITKHRVHLTDLTPGTIYHYKTMSRDRAGNLRVSDEYTFTTKREVIEPEPILPEPEEPVIPEPIPPKPEKEQETPWGLIAGIIIGLVLVAGGIIYWRRQKA